MTRTYHYHGFTLQIAVESGFNFLPGNRRVARPAYVAVVRIFQSGNAAAIFSPLRLGEAGGRPFDTEVDAIMGGYSAARRFVDDRFGRDPH
jgi:hypothetical protein